MHVHVLNIKAPLGKHNNATEKIEKTGKPRGTKIPQPMTLAQIMTDYKYCQAKEDSERESESESVKPN